MATADTACEARASRQHGLITRDQAFAFGLTRAQIRYRVEQRRWRVMFPGIYLVGGARMTWEARVAAAVEWSGPVSAATGSTGAALYGLDGCRKGSIEVSTTRSLRRTPFRCHRVKALSKGDFTRRDGIRTMRMPLLLRDLAADASTAVVERATVDAVRRRFTTLPELRRTLDTCGGRGDRGSQSLRLILDHVDPRETVTANEFERRLFTILREAGLPLPSPQVSISIDGEIVGRFDFAYEGHRIVIEADGFRWHSDSSRLDLDKERNNRLILSGYIVLRFTWKDVTVEGEGVAESIRSALSIRGVACPKPTQAILRLS